MKVELMRDVDGVGRMGDRVSLAPDVAEEMIGRGDAKAMKGHD